MAGFDEGGIYFSNQELLNLNEDGGDGSGLYSTQQAQLKFAEFIRNFTENEEDRNASSVKKYCDALVQDRRMLRVDLRDVKVYDAQLHSALILNPSDYLPLLESAASQVLKQLQAEEGEEEAGGGHMQQQGAKEVQICLYSSEPLGKSSMRELTSLHVSQLVQLPGIVTSASKPRNKATYLTIQCTGCRSTKTIACQPGLGGTVLPRACDRAGVMSIPNMGAEKCPLDPWVVVASRTKYVDQQTLKIQERPEDVPVGDLPRSMLSVVDRHLTCQTKPGTRVMITGIFSIFQSKEAGGGRGSDKRGAVALRQPYLRVVGLQEDVAGDSTTSPLFTNEEENEFRQFAASPRVLEEVFALIAPNIHGHTEIKKAVACLLFGGARKRMPDGTFRRGDINVLLLGDPSTGKSQFLKFASQTSPIAVYTSGKGSSAAGLTASVIRDATSGEFYLEAGAMVLADNGVVCIDEFDKMRAEDRVAIHEAMEQQTISIAKAGITTMLKSRTSVLAAANPPSGRYDDLKTAQENIDLQSTILSRFDLIFIVKDERSIEKDKQIAKFVMDVHRTGVAREMDDESKAREAFLRKYIQFCKGRCYPRLSEDASKLLVSEYVLLRQEVKKALSGEGSDVPPIPITVRQLEAIVRIAESLARMSLQPVATEGHVRMAMELFQISTMDAVKSGLSDSVVLTDEQRHEIHLVEQQIKRRLAIGSYVSERKLVDELVRVGLNDHLVRKALLYMAQSGDVEMRRERSLVHRLR